MSDADYKLFELQLLRRRIEELRRKLHPTQPDTSQRTESVQELQPVVEQVSEKEKRRANELDAIKKKLMSKK